jgi:hypothetical protein
MAITTSKRAKSVSPIEDQRMIIIPDRADGFNDIRREMSKIHEWRLKNGYYEKK